MNVLVINCGSSSLKYQLIDSETEAVLAKGLCERIGIDGRLVYQKIQLTRGCLKFLLCIIISLRQTLQPAGKRLLYAQYKLVTL